MKKSPRTMQITAPKQGHIKAILRGGTFNSVRILMPEGQAYVEHGGLNYKVTRQRNAQGLVICTWSRA
jgi:hypothetical protein